MKRTYLSF